MKKFNAAPAHAESAKLEFPDWSSMDDSAARVNADVAFRLCEHYPAWFPEAAAKWQERQPEKCAVEFIL